MRELGFTKGSVTYGDRLAPAAIFTCQDCGDQHAERIPSNSLNPEALAKRARAAGWEANSHGIAGTRCPNCIHQRRRAAASTPLKKEAPVTAPATVTPIQPSPAPEAREPTTQQRLNIRGKLDAVFDDQAGMYLDGYSDQKIGEELKLPWSWVAKIRDAAYGPIRVDPEIVALRAEITGLQAEHKKFGERMAQAMARLDAMTARRKAS